MIIGTTGFIHHLHQVIRVNIICSESHRCEVTALSCAEAFTFVRSQETSAPHYRLFYKSLTSALQMCPRPHGAARDLGRIRDDDENE